MNQQNRSLWMELQGRVKLKKIQFILLTSIFQLLKEKRQTICNNCARRNTKQICKFTSNTLKSHNYLINKLYFFFCKTWMNLWPMKKGSYDPLTYDVRKTSTVRVMLHGPWLEIRFPKTNLPFRRVHDEDEPTAIDFHSR